MMSPHAWGWSDLRRGRPKGREVVPTRVGMVRLYCHSRSAPARCSPHAWGWSDRRPACESSCCRFPHTRGDGPRAARATPFASLFSPHAWGWSGTPSSTAGGRHRCPHTRGDGPGRNDFMTFLGLDLPTRVGMVRAASPCARSRSGCPHTRGDGPIRREPDEVRRAMSPHAWGWTVWLRELHLRVADVPTRVGMDRCRRPTCAWGWRCPHTRGDGPRSQVYDNAMKMMSPHAWGWTRRRYRAGWPRVDVPTRVGMDRCRRGRSARRPRCPHTRGDGPVTCSST